MTHTDRNTETTTPPSAGFSTTALARLLAVTRREWGI